MSFARMVAAIAAVVVVLCAVMAVLLWRGGDDPAPAIDSDAAAVNPRVFEPVAFERTLHDFTAIAPAVSTDASRAQTLMMQLNRSRVTEAHDQEYERALSGIAEQLEVNSDWLSGPDLAARLALVRMSSAQMTDEQKLQWREVIAERFIRTTPSAVLSTGEWAEAYQALAVLTCKDSEDIYRYAHVAEMPEHLKNQLMRQTPEKRNAALRGLVLSQPLAIAGLVEHLLNQIMLGVDVPIDHETAAFMARSLGPEDREAMAEALASAINRVEVNEMGAQILSWAHAYGRSLHPTVEKLPDRWQTDEAVDRGTDVVHHWQTQLEERLQDPGLVGDQRAAWLLVRAYAGEVRQKPERRSPLGGRLWTLEALGTAQTPAMRAKVVTYIADRLAEEGAFTEAASLIADVRLRFGGDHQIESIAARLKVTEQARQSRAEQMQARATAAHQQQLRSRLEQAELRGDREDVQRYQRLLASVSE